MIEIPADIFWRAFSGRQAQFSVGGATARRYAPGFSPIVAFADVNRPDFAALTPYCNPGEVFYTDGWTGESADGWEIQKESMMVKMVWDAPCPQAQETGDMGLLGPEHAEQALELAILTNPGPFGLRTFELGDYFGFFDGQKLVAMAGERLQADEFREVSGVCTHPEYVGRGYASRMVRHLVLRQLERNQRPFLHVMSHNEGARALYRKLGFRESLESVVRVIAPHSLCEGPLTCG